MVLDIDGTLVDSNYQHAIAWHRALHENGYSVRLWEIHRHIGMGGDQLVQALVGEKGERADGEGIRAAEGEAYGDLIDEVEAVDGASELLRELQEDGAVVVLASSAKAAEVGRYLDLLDARRSIDHVTTAADAEQTKPEPDLVEAALAKTGRGGPAVMVGDSTWDVKAASAAGIPTLAVLTGGFSAAELREAGAVRVLESIGELREDRSTLSEIAG